MRVGWLCDQHDWQGGAELTMEEFRKAAPEDVEIVPCPAGDVKQGLDRYVVGNCVTYREADLGPLRGRKVVKYVNDVWPHSQPGVRGWLLENAELVFCSPLHVERFPWDIPDDPHLIPPPVDLSEFRKHGGHVPKAKRKGTVWIGMAFYGKGIRQAEEWAQENGPVDFYGGGPMMPKPSAVVVPQGHIPYEGVPDLLAHYKRFLFLPTQIEPFGRTVAEAWAAGCELVVNRNCGALYWIKEAPEKIDSAAEDFWALVLA